jgi:hypothetical protein
MEGVADQQIDGDGNADQGEYPFHGMGLPFIGAGQDSYGMRGGYDRSWSGIGFFFVKVAKKALGPSRPLVELSLMVFDGRAEAEPFKHSRLERLFAD